MGQYNILHGEVWRGRTHCTRTEKTHGGGVCVGHDIIGRIETQTNDRGAVLPCIYTRVVYIILCLPVWKS